MAYTTVMNVQKAQNFQDYTLEAKEALVAAFEQGCGNFQTWTYKTPDEYPIRETKDTYRLGKFFVWKKKEEEVDTLNVRRPSFNLTDL